MQYLSLGRTDLQVSRLALGTAAFGLDRYGIQKRRESGVVSEKNAVRLVRTAVEQGINFFDTARGYGESEAVLGKGLANYKPGVIATKVTVPPDYEKLSSTDFANRVMDSLETSLRALGRDVLDIVHIHNATSQVLQECEILNILEGARTQGKLRFIGASVYGEDAALAAIRSGRVDVLQVAINLLDQRMLAKVLPEASQANVAIVARSCLLKGVLTERANLLPPHLHALKAAAKRVGEALGETWESLPKTAIRFCLSLPGVTSVLLGLRSLSELRAALAAEEAGPLADAVIRKVDELKLTDENLLNPSVWPTA